MDSGSHSHFILPGGRQVSTRSVSESCFTCDRLGHHVPPAKAQEIGRNLGITIQSEAAKDKIPSIKV